MCVSNPVPPSAARVTAPRLVGVTVHQARTLGHDHGVVVTSADIDGPPLGALTWPGTWVVTAQRPVAGSRVPRWSSVVIEFQERPDEGGAGVREPREPLPQPPLLRAERDPGDGRGDPGDSMRPAR